MAAPELHRPNLREKHAQQLRKTQMCKFFMQTRCGEGSNCPFAHGISEIRQKPDLNRTSMCQQFLQTGNCRKPNCTFAHDERELRTTSGFSKTKLCRFAPSGRCKHGSACRFAHSFEEMTPEAQQAALLEQQAAADCISDSMAAAAAWGAAEAGGGQFPVPPGAEPFDYMQEGADYMQDLDAGRQQAVNVGDWVDSISDQSVHESASGPGSDQSTRAETNMSVPTPEGSGDSGQEEPKTPPSFHLPRSGGTTEQRNRRSERRNGGGSEKVMGRHCTTMMITNVPEFLTQGALLSLLEDLTLSMRGAFDFFFCPWNHFQDCNLGYLIINFFSRSQAGEFEQRWANQQLLPRSQWSKRLRIVAAALQGRAANLRHFSGFSLAHHPDPRFRPLVRATPGETLQPMALPEELGSGQQPSDGSGPDDAPGGASKDMPSSPASMGAPSGWPDSGSLALPGREAAAVQLSSAAGLWGGGVGGGQYVMVQQPPRAGPNWPGGRGEARPDALGVSAFGAPNLGAPAVCPLGMGLGGADPNWLGGRGEARSDMLGVSAFRAPNLGVPAICPLGMGLSGADPSWLGGRGEARSDMLGMSAFRAPNPGAPAMCPLGAGLSGMAGMLGASTDAGGAGPLGVPFYTNGIAVGLPYLPSIASLPPQGRA